MDIESFVVEENKLSNRDEIYYSASRKYYLHTSKYKTIPHFDNICRGVVYHDSDKKQNFDVVRNYGVFPFCFIEAHPNGHDYLVCGADYQGQTVLELDTGKRIDYLPKGAEKGVGWCWAHITVSVEKNVLGVEGCYWACPNDVRFIDFSEPMNLPFLVLAELYNVVDTPALNNYWSAERGVEIEISDAKGVGKRKVTWLKPTLQEVAHYWQEQVRQTDPQSHFLPDIKEQADLAAKKLARP
jgi:hypothetical protein